MTQVACPELVPLIQAGDTHGHAIHEAAKRYAEPLKEADVDTVILGCTHYPLIRPMLQRIFGRDVALITSAEEVAREVAATLERRGVGNDPAARATTGSSAPATRPPFARWPAASCSCR